MVIWEQSVNYDAITFKPLPRPSGIKGRVGPYADCLAAFDIETTRLTEIEQSVMYVWQFCLDFPDGHDLVILGRTWREFKHMTYKLGERLGNLHLKTYIHNASYEFQYLAGIYDFRPHEVFAMESRSVLSFTMYKRFEFFCSYKLFNMSLDAATAKYCPEYHKKSGAEYEYTKRRFYDTPLTRRELLYSVYDVWGLCKAVRVLMRLHDDNLYTIPRTATGFVRREVRVEMSPYHAELCRAWPDYDLYKRLRIAFRGGNTHANRYYAGDIIEDVHSVDISSSYPSQQCTKQFPVTPFKRVPLADGALFDKLRERGRALLIHCRFYNLRLRDKYTSVPYLPLAKCVRIQDYENDNGRLLCAKLAETVLTDIDFAIVERQYKFRLEIVDLYKSHYGPLPAPLVDINRRYFAAKTELKGVPGQELYYMKSKNLLNAIYGMSVQDPINPEIIFESGEYVEDLAQTPEQLLQRAGKAPYTLYQYGVWTTAHARDALQAGIDLCGDGLIYVDTDSCKYVGSPDFGPYNAERERIATERGACAADKSGTTHYMGVYEDDGSYKRFITLGAKKYAFEDSRGKLGITVAGVPKKTGAAELQRKGGLEAFKPGFVFNETGKLESVYNDADFGRFVADGRRLNITRNTVLRETTYKLDITPEYAELLNMSAKCLNNAIKFWRNSQL